MTVRFTHDTDGWRWVCVGHSGEPMFPPSDPHPDARRALAAFEAEARAMVKSRYTAHPVAYFAGDWTGRAVPVEGLDLHP